MKHFEVPVGYRSTLISAIKNKRKEEDKLKKDFSPALIDIGPLKIYLARHFGFCYGVENAIEIAYKTIEENKGKRIFLLSEMIHNPQVNADLTKKGVQFLHDTNGNEIIPLSNLTKEDVVIIPAFGTTLELEAKINAIGIEIHKYNTTCPFVEKVWNRGDQIAKKGFTIIIHGKPKHEETRATFSHAAHKAPTLIVNDMQEAIVLGKIITGELPISDFEKYFKNRYSAGFNPNIHFEKLGVINQTTQLATDTQAISDYLKNIVAIKYGKENLTAHFADTRDTLCYATNDNQSAVLELLNTPADLAIVMGGKNSSNSSHLVELCEQKLPTYFIDDANKIIDENKIIKTNWNDKSEEIIEKYLPAKNTVTILMTSGASCPDTVVESVIRKIAGYYNVEEALDDVIQFWQSPN
ncbi:MAG: 4-hydroxy-3-methylbut-2-enyl diphosphate reductase [Sediminibacterium sp.]|jgi:4-hydroxy-3-methylbut-2-enyl diphosphate reductase|nr:MAG: 4-hydroxy-3-methylbut-2-enyl diphosphate reductase [Sediminibacterium sp.]